MKETKDIENRVIKDAPIACNGNATRLIDYLVKGQSYVLFFTGETPTIDDADLTYKLYDAVVNKYNDALQPVVITKLVPMGLKDREIILDLEGVVFKAFDISENPKIAFVDNQSVLGISKQMTVNELTKYIESNHSLNKEL